MHEVGRGMVCKNASRVRSNFLYDVRLRSYGASNLTNFQILAFVGGIYMRSTECPSSYGYFSTENCEVTLLFLCNICSDDRDEYRVYLLLLAHNASKDAGRRRRLVGDHVTGRVRLCAKDGDVNSSSVEHVVKEVVVTERRQGLRTLNIVMVDSYIHDNVDYFYVVHSVTKPTDIDLFDNSSTLPIR